MDRIDKLLLAILSGRLDATIDFGDLCSLLRALVFSSRGKGSRHILWRDSVPKIVNLQSKGDQAKPYPVKRVRESIVRYRLAEFADQ